MGFFHFSPTDESGFEWKRPVDEKRHMCARAGDHLACPFQCDVCVARNLLGRNPMEQDWELMACIRQVNLDALWGREVGTVDSTRRSVEATVKLLKEVGLEPPYPALGPHPVADTWGYAVAIAMLRKSRKAGRNAPNYQQFDTIRKLRAGFYNVYMITPEGGASLRSMGGSMTKFYLGDCPTHSLFFERFTTGCLSRMGQITRQDLAISLDVMHALMNLLEDEWEKAEGPKARHWIASVGAFSVIGFCGSFRGPEVFLVDLHGLKKYSEERIECDGIEVVIIPLLGRFKTELGFKYHLTPMVAETKSGLPVKRWIHRLLGVQAEKGLEKGPAFTDDRGNMVAARDYEVEILERLKTIQERYPELIPADVDVFEEYGISRSFRRGGTSTARARGVNGDDVDIINRWRNFENAKGHRPRMKMRDHYSDIRLMIPSLIRFSHAL